MIVSIHRFMFDQHFDNGGNREEVTDTMPFHQLPKEFRIQFITGHQNQRGSSSHIQKHVHSCSMGEGGYRNRYILFSGSGNEIGKMIVNNKIHLSMGQHSCFGSARCPRCIEKPKRIIIFNRFIFKFLPQMAFNHGFIILMISLIIADANQKFE